MSSSFAGNRVRIISFLHLFAKPIFFARIFGSESLELIVNRLLIDSARNGTICHIFTTQLLKVVLRKWRVSAGPTSHLRIWS